MEAKPQRKLGAFLGVYTPTVLTILGVIMYLRSGWVTGHLGLTKTLMVVILANSITLVTTLSFSSMATNMRVGVGGAYFIISRSLGLGIGAAVGLPLFLSQAISVTLYSFGLAESLSIVWPGIPVQAATVVIILLVAALSYRGAEFALRTQVPLLMLVGLSLVALALGMMWHREPAEAAVVAASDVTFWHGFAVFFPAVTGVMAGLSLSGDLKDPSRAIPMGAILATMTGFVVYLLIPVVLDYTASPEELRSDPLIWLRIAPLGALLILPGMWGAILSSGVGSMLGAPRTIQSVTRDQLARTGLGRIVASPTGVRVATIASTVIALTAVFLGDLNAVAEVVTMFFLTVYGTVNVVAAVETLSGDPSWRPRFHIPWWLNLAAGLACAWVMLLINPLASVAAIAIEILLWMFFVRREQKATWGDARRGLYEALFRWALIRLARRPMSARNWRPHVLAFVDDPLKHLDMIRFGCWFSQERGVVTVCELLTGDLLDNDFDLSKRQQEIQKLMNSEDLTVFAEVDVVNRVVEGILNVAQANGMAGMTSNTILLGWPKDPERLAEFLVTVRRLEKLRKSVVIGRIHPQYVFPRRKSHLQVHVWWGGMKQNGDLMLLLAYLLTRNSEWRGAELRILCAASNDFAKQNTERYLTDLIQQTRIDAEYDVFIKPEDRHIKDVIQERSAGADAVFLGLATPELGDEAGYAERLTDLAGDLPVVFFVKNSSLFVGKLLEPAEVG